LVLLPQKLQTMGKLACLGAGLLALSACGQTTTLDLTEILSVAMQGTFEAPPAAAGNAEPKAVTFSIEGLTLTRDDGTVDDLFEGETEPKEVRIINRPQIVYEPEVHDFVDVAYTKLTLTLSATATAKGKYEDEMPVTLAQPVAEFVDTFTVEKAKGMRLDVSVQWKNTVARDDDAETETMSSPTFVLDMTSE
jgi:hypothetical protein